MAKALRVKNKREAFKWVKKLEKESDAYIDPDLYQDIELEKIEKELKIINRKIVNIMTRIIKLEIINNNKNDNTSKS